MDSNVLLDIVTDDPTWVSRSTTAFARAVDEGHVFINPVVYAEVSVGPAVARLPTVDDRDGRRHGTSSPVATAQIPPECQLPEPQVTCLWHGGSLKSQ